MADTALFTHLLRLADDHLILGHRLSEWCGHAPMLEEDLAMPNIALDMIGQARALYTLAGAVEGAGRDEDALAYLRLERDYLNCLLVERPNGDFAHTMLRLFWFAACMEQVWAAGSSDTRLAEIAARAAKETAYHVRHAGEWVVRLGDGTEESARRLAAAAEALAPYLEELFIDDAVAMAAAEGGFAPLPSSLKRAWTDRVDKVHRRARLDMPEAPVIAGGRSGRHGEEMGHLLAELQYVQRAYPGLRW